MNFNQQLLVTYECVSAIGTSLELKTMISHFLRVFSKKTGAIVSAYWEKDANDYVCVSGQGKKSLLFKIKPKNIDNRWLVIVHEDNSKTLFIEVGEGVMSFLFAQDDTAVKLIESILNSIFTKLNNAILACIQHDKLMKLNQELSDKVKDEVKKNRDKDKHMLQKSKQAQMGEMISMIAHQWRQPLSSISTVVAGLKLKQVLKKYDLSTIEGQENHCNNLSIQLTKIEGYTQFLTNTIDDFRNFFKPDKNKEEVLLVNLVEKTFDILKKSFEISKIQVNIDNSSEKKVLLYTNEVMQVILNILKNSEDAFKEINSNNAEVRIKIYNNENNVVLEIQDNAGGIPENIIDNVFEPYFSTKDEKNGTGLGLYMSKIIVEEHCNGLMTVSNGAEGANFKLIFKEIQ